MVKVKFEAYFVVKKNVTFERAKFKLRVNKLVSQRIFHNMLLLSYEYCESRTLRDDLTRERIVVAIEDKKLYEQLQF